MTAGVDDVRSEIRELLAEMRALDARMSDFTDALYAQARLHAVISMGSAFLVGGSALIVALIV